MYHILIAGAGYAGRAIAENFVSKKQKVWALTRSPEKAAVLEQAGIHPVIADLTQPETLHNLPPAHFIVICPAPDERTEESYRAVYLDGIGNFLDSRRTKPAPSLIVYLSSTGVWDGVENGDIDESFDPQPQSVRAKILLAAERQILMAPYPSVVFRLSGIYGPGRNSLERIRAGKWPEENPGKYMNVIHRDDIVSGVEKLFSKAVPGEVYLGVDDEPIVRAEFLSWLAEQLNLNLPVQFETAKLEKHGKRCQNKKLKALGWQPQYSNIKEGYEALLQKEKV